MYPAFVFYLWGRYSAGSAFSPSQVMEKCKKAGVAVGTIAATPADAQRLIDQGVQLIALSSDQAMIAYAGKAFMKELGRTGRAY